MFNNYFYLSRAVFELNQKLCGSRITAIYTQEKNLLFFHIPSEEFPDRHLLISTNPQKPYLLIKERHKKAKKNIVDFFSQILSSEILNFQISTNDRIIKISLDKGDLIFRISGRDTNVYLVDDQKKKSQFKKSSTDISSIIGEHTFHTGGKFDPGIDDTPINDIKILKKRFPMISSEIKNEIIFRKEESSDRKQIELFQNIVNEIFSSEISVGINTDLGKFIFVPASFYSLKANKENRLFSDFNSALNHYLASFFKENKTKNISSELDKYFESELSKLSSKLNKLKSRIDEGPKDTLYYRYAELLLSNKAKLKKGMDSVSITDYSTSEEIIINLIPKISPQANIDKYFEKARDEKVNFKKSLELFKFTEEKFEKIKSEYDKYVNAESFDEIQIIYDNVLPKKEKIIKMSDGLKFKYWHYIIDGKYNVYIGRDSKSNDYLSIKFAKQNDYWFHARGMPGSHVVLKVENSKEVIPKNIIKHAASLAAYYSKAKTAGTVPVSYTFAKFVYKKKGMEPGKVFLSKENTVLVRPEIPQIAELINE